jgi:hypothetical protein
MSMSLSEILEAVRVLPPQEKAQVKALLDAMEEEEKENGILNNTPINQRHLRLRGVTAQVGQPSITLEELKEARREMWRGYMGEDFDE